MGCIPVAMSCIAAYLIYDSDHGIVFVIALLVGLGCLWSWGVMHNYAVEAAKNKSNYQGGFSDFTAQEAESVPNWLAGINIGFSVASLVLLIVGIIIAV